MLPRPLEQTPHWVTPHPQTTIPPAPISSGQTLLSSIVSWCCGMLVAFLCFFSTPPHWKSGAKAGGSPRHSSCTAGRGASGAAPRRGKGELLHRVTEKPHKSPQSPACPGSSLCGRHCWGSALHEHPCTAPEPPPGAWSQAPLSPLKKPSCSSSHPPAPGRPRLPPHPPGSGCSGRSTQQTLPGTGLAAGEGEAMPPRSSHPVPTPAQASARFP